MTLLCEAAEFGPQLMSIVSEASSALLHFWADGHDSQAYSGLKNVIWGQQLFCERLLSGECRVLMKREKGRKASGV